MIEWLIFEEEYWRAGAPLRVNQNGIFLLGPARQVFVGQRLDTPEAWQMPQGGIDPGEEAEEAAIRELGEETGVHGGLDRKSTRLNSSHQI